MFIKSVEKDKKLYLIPVLEALQLLFYQLENGTTAKKAIKNAMLDLVVQFHQCSGLTARMVYQIVVEATISIPGPTFGLNRVRYYLTSRLHERLSGDDESEHWPLRYQIKLKQDLYRIPQLRRIETKNPLPAETQTELSAADVEKKLLEFQQPSYQLGWMLDSN